MTSDSPTERYLHAWHLRNPDASRVFLDARDSAGRSSYQRLALVADGATAVLDVACGTGILLSLVHDLMPSARLLGIDLSQSELELAVRRATRACFSVSRAQALPVATGSVDLVLCHMALMLMDRPESVLSEIRRVLHAGGRFVAITNRPAATHPAMKEILRALRPAWEHVDASRRPPVLGDRRTFEGESLAALVRAEFDHVLVEEFDAVQYVPREKLWPFIVDSHYGFDAIPSAEAAALLDGLTLPDRVRWTLPMVQIQASVMV